MIEEFVTTPTEALAARYENHAMTLALDPLPPPHMVWGNKVKVAAPGAIIPPGCWDEVQRLNASDGQLVPPHLQATLHADVGFLRSCNVHMHCRGCGEAPESG